MALLVNFSADRFATLTFEVADGTAKEVGFAVISKAERKGRLVLRCFEEDQELYAGKGLVIIERMSYPDRQRVEMRTVGKDNFCSLGEVELDPLPGVEGTLKVRYKE